MNSLTFADAGEAGSHDLDGGSYLVTASEANNTKAVIYSGILNRDVDGAPNCYARFPNIHGGLDGDLRDATSNAQALLTPLPTLAFHHNWKWVGVVSMTHDEADAAGLLGRLDERTELAGLNGDPNHPQPNPDPAHPPKFPVVSANNPGFYVSTTAWARNTHPPETDSNHWWDATLFSYGALTPPLADLGVRLGDFGLAIRRDTGDSEAFFFADVGNQNKVGEMSDHLFRILFPHGHEEGHPVAFLVFPGSRHGHPLQNQQLNPNAIAGQTIREQISNLSSYDNVRTVAGLMASGLPFGQKQHEAFEIRNADDPQHRRRVDVVYGRDQASLDRIENALRPFGYNPRVPPIAPLNIAIPAPNLGGLPKLKAP